MELQTGVQFVHSIIRSHCNSAEAPRTIDECCDRTSFRQAAGGLIERCAIGKVALDRSRGRGSIESNDLGSYRCEGISDRVPDSARGSGDHDAAAFEETGGKAGQCVHGSPPARALRAAIHPKIAAVPMVRPAAG